MSPFQARFVSPPSSADHAGGRNRRAVGPVRMKCSRDASLCGLKARTSTREEPAIRFSIVVSRLLGSLGAEALDLLSVGS
jgi:hypothetical protein